MKSKISAVSVVIGLLGLVAFMVASWGYTKGYREVWLEILSYLFVVSFFVSTIGIVIAVGMNLSTPISKEKRPKMGLRVRESPGRAFASLLVVFFGLLLGVYGALEGVQAFQVEDVRNFYRIKRGVWVFVKWSEFPGLALANAVSNLVFGAAMVFASISFFIFGKE